MRVRAKSKKGHKKLYLVLGIIVGVIILGYFSVSFYFMSHFYPNTKINGKDFSGKTVSAVEDYLKSQVNGYKLEIQENDGKKDSIIGQDISLEYKENGDAKKALEKQNALLWPGSIFSGKSEKINLEITYDLDALDKQIQQIQAVTKEQIPSENAKPEFNGETYVVKAEVIGSAVNMEQLQDKIHKYISEFQSTLNMEKENCYQKPQYTSESKEVKEACDLMNKYCAASITYPMNEPVVVDRQLISQWIAVDDKMQVVLNTEAMKNWLSEFGNKYDTVGSTRNFTTPTGKSTSVSGGTYGWSINEEGELSSLQNDIMNGQVTTREPAYYNGGTAAAHAMPDWGNTFVEVDLSAQHMWYVSGGSIVLETDVVTGETIPEMITPEGTYNILDKKLDEILVGEINPATGEPLYRTHVDYWMRVTWSGIGFHDADWQTAFGGTLNQIHGVGSHGCINMPVDQAAALYGMLEVGTPVIIHY